MRICLLIPGPLSFTSGGYLYDRHLVEFLRRQGHQVDVASLRPRPYAASLLANLDSRLPRPLELGGYDALLQDELAHPSLFAANAGIRKRLRCPVVSVVHHLLCREPGGRSLFSPVQRAVERRYLESADALVLSSCHARECTRTLLSGLPEHVVAPPGADHAGHALSPHSITQRSDDGPLQLLFVGHVTPRKGLLDSLRTLALIKDVPWELHAAGNIRSDPRYADKVRRFIRQEGLRDRVRILGKVSDEQLQRLYRECHAMYMPFAYEGFGIVFLEAMAAGLPVLARRACGPDEIVRHGENGFLFSPGDHAGPAAKVRELAGDRRRLAAMGLTAGEAFLRHPTWDQSMSRVEAFLAELCRRPGST